jgi:hypothetical protein
MPQKPLFRVEARVIDALGRYSTTHEFVKADTEEEAKELAQSRFAARSLSVVSILETTRGRFAEDARLPPEKPAARWEPHPEDPTIWRFEFFPLAYVMVHSVPAGEHEYLVWLEFNGQPSIEDHTIILGRDEDELAIKKGACSVGSQWCLDMVRVLSQFITHPPR